jgi:triacylglycerol esterase/lipase EstA (alpha/beta hydrolase family)
MAGSTAAIASAFAYSQSSSRLISPLTLSVVSLIFAERLITLNRLMIAAVATAALSGWLLLTSAVMFTDHLAQGSDSKIAKLVHGIHAIVFGVNAVLISAALFPFTAHRPFHGPYGDVNSGTPIILINGYLSYGSNWYFQAKKLAEAKIGPVYTMNVGTFKSIPTYYAPFVADEIDKILESFRKKEVNLVCHSKGGLVGSYYATELAQKHGVNVKKVVTLGTPYGGSAVADKIGVGQDAEEMQTGSAFTTNLKKSVQQLTTTQFYQISAEYDLFITEESAKIENSAGSYRFNNLSHLGLIISLKPIEKIIEWIKAV